MRNSFDLTLAVAFGVAASGCSTAGSTQRPDAPRELLVRTVDYSFSAPDTIPAGITSVRLVNDGHEMHHVQLLRIGKGHTFDDLRKSAASGVAIPPWVTPVGGANASTPKDDARVTLGLAVGEYAMICFISSPADPRPHYAKGMLRHLVVREGSAGEARAPAPDGAIVLRNYSFSVTPLLRAGRHTLRVENAADQPHEVVIARLAPGKTISDLFEWMKRQDGPPPGEPAGGTTAIAPAGVNYLTASFAPGNYVMLCFVPDASDGRSHLQHGMLSEFRVD